MTTNSNSYFYITGRILLSVLFALLAIRCFWQPYYLGESVPTFMGAPQIWVWMMGVIWAIGSISFLFNSNTRLFGSLITALIVLILTASTYRGFSSPQTFVSTVLAFGFYFATMGGALMVAAQGQWMPIGMKANMPPSDDLFYAGRMLTGCFFFTAGWLHLSHITADAAMISQIPGGIFLVVFTGLCWFGVAFSFWCNILSRLAAVMASLLILIISILVNAKGFGQGHDLDTVVQLAYNLGLIGSCMLVAQKGHWGLNVTSWWYPPKSWGLDLGKENSIDHTSK